MSNQHAQPYMPHPVPLSPDIRQALIRAAGRTPSVSLRVLLNALVAVEAERDEALARVHTLEIRVEHLVTAADASATRLLREHEAPTLSRRTGLVHISMFRQMEAERDTAIRQRDHARAHADYWRAAFDHNVSGVPTPGGPIEFPADLAEEDGDWWHKGI